MQQERNTVKLVDTESLELYKLQYSYFQWDHIVSKPERVQSAVGPLVFATKVKTYFFEYVRCSKKFNFLLFIRLYFRCIQRYQVAK